MTTSYLNSLEDRLRPVARLIFSSDIERCVNLSHSNRYTRLYLRRIIERAKIPPFNLIITNQTLAKLFRISLNNFVQWFQYNVYLKKVFHRVRCFLREIIIAIIYEDRGELDTLIDGKLVQKRVKEPTRKTMAHWRKLTKAIRQEAPHHKPVIKTLAEAEETLEWIQNAQCSSDSSESDDENIDHGDSPDEERSGSEETFESFALNGSPVILTADQLYESFKNIHIKLDISDDHRDGNASFFGVDHL